ncbi:MAG: transcriptional repressor [Candidatus Rokubacteria bacterium]|nr:transcriptional repressor [Candidatus Rokubacteria bacterium]
MAHLVGRLKEAEGRITSQRLGIIRALVYNKNHPSVEDIYRELRPTFPTLSIATVYKTLERLKRMGEVLELEFREGRNRYDGMKPEPHTHLMCTDCGRILDLEFELPAGRASSLARTSGFRLRAVRLDLYGVCKRCRRKGS